MSVGRCLNVESRDLPHLVSDYGPAGGSGVGRDDNTAIIQAADDGRSRRCGLGQRDAFGVESDVSVVVAEVEARHRGGSAAWCKLLVGVYVGMARRRCESCDRGDVGGCLVQLKLMQSRMELQAGRW